MEKVVENCAMGRNWGAEIDEYGRVILEAKDLLTAGHILAELCRGKDREIQELKNRKAFNHAGISQAAYGEEIGHEH